MYLLKPIGEVVQLLWWWVILLFVKWPHWIVYLTKLRVLTLFYKCQKKPFCDSHSLKTASMHPKFEVLAQVLPWVASTIEKPSDWGLPGWSHECWLVCLSTVPKFPLTSNWRWEYFQNITGGTLGGPGHPASVSRPSFGSTSPPALPPVITSPFLYPSRAPWKLTFLELCPHLGLVSWTLIHAISSRLHYPNLSDFISVCLTRLLRPNLWNSAFYYLCLILKIFSMISHPQQGHAKWLFQAPTSYLFRKPCYCTSDVCSVGRLNKCLWSTTMCPCPPMTWALSPQGGSRQCSGLQFWGLLGMGGGEMGESQSQQRKNKSCSKEVRRNEGMQHRPGNGPPYAGIPVSICLLLNPKPKASGSSSLKCE